MLSRVRIATRKSVLALWQAQHVRTRLIEAHPELTVDVVPMASSGDRILDRPLARVGGKGLFIKELEQALLNENAELAVHSMKDVPATLADEFELPVILESGDPRDAFVSNDYQTLDELPRGARLGTSSLRRQMMMRHRRPDLEVESLRGNVQTRLGKLDAGDFDAIILASAGLHRVGLSHRIRQVLPPGISLPAIGQGALGIEIRKGDAKTLALIEGLDHPETHARLRAERGLSARLGGSCSIPLAGYAELDGERLTLRGALGTPDGRTLLAERMTGTTGEARVLGIRMAERLLKRGAADILSSLDLGWVDPGGA